jgi:VanZ family protein
VNRRLALLAVGYAALVAYASLYPFTGWKATGLSPFAFLAWPVASPRADVLANFLGYVPLGLLLALSLRSLRAVAALVILATLLGTAFSLSIEILQQYLPKRVPSQADLAANAAGSLFGALLGVLLSAERLLGKTLAHWRNRWVKPGRQFELGLVALGAWALSQWMPAVPSFDVGALREGVAPLWRTAQHPESFDLLRWGRYALYLSGLALVARTLGNPGRPVVAAFFAFVALVLAYKVPVIGRQLSLEAVAGALSAVALTGLWLALRVRTIACIGAIFIVGGFLCAHILPGPGSPQHLTNWRLFGPLNGNQIATLASTLEILWPAAALGYLARIAAGPEARRVVAWGGGAALALALIALPWQGKAMDPATALLIAGTWTLFCGLGRDPLAPRTDNLGPRLASTALPVWTVMILAAALISAPGITEAHDGSHSAQWGSAAAR